MSSSSHQNAAPQESPEAIAATPELDMSAELAMEPLSIEEIGDSEMELLDDVLDPEELDDFDDLAALDVEQVTVIEEPPDPSPTRRRRAGGDLLDTLEMPVFKVPEDQLEDAPPPKQAAAPEPEPEPEPDPEPDPEHDEKTQRGVPLAGILRGRGRPAPEERSAPPEELPDSALFPDIIQRRPVALGTPWLNGPPPGSSPDRPQRPAPAPAPEPEAPAPLPPAEPTPIEPTQRATGPVPRPAAPPQPAAPPVPAPTVPAPPLPTPPAPQPAAALPPTPAPQAPAPPPQPPPLAAAPPLPSAPPLPPVQPVVGMPTHTGQITQPVTPPSAQPPDPALLFSTRVPGGDKAFTFVRSKRHAKPANKQDELSGLVQELLGEDKPAQKPAEEEPPQAIPWWQLVFTEEYFRTIPMGFHRQTIREARFIAESLGVGEGATILDLCCGFGRHTIELAKRGYDMAGLDLSMPLLQKALREAQRRSLSIKFIHGDVRELSFNGIFDAIFSFQTSFGYFDDRTSFNILRGVARALKPGGRFLIEVTNRDWIVPRLPLRIWWEGPECLFLEEVEMDYTTSTLHTKRSYIYDDGRPPWEQNIFIRTYSAHELRRMLELAGLRVLSLSGSIQTRGYFLGPDSPQIILLAERPMG